MSRGPYRGNDERERRMSRTDDEARTGTVRSVERALDIIELLGHRTDPASAGIIASVCGIPKSSLHNLLNALRTRRYVTYHPSRRAWSLGPRVLELSAEAPLFVHAIAVLRAFRPDARDLTLDEIAHHADLPHATVARVLPQMQQYDLIAANPDGTYRLGLELVSLSSRVGWVEHVRLAALPHLVWLRDITGETANLIVRDGTHALYVDQVESRNALRHSGWVGRRVPLDGTATGAALATPGSSQVAIDAVEQGVTAIVCAIDDPLHPAAVGVTAPSWRIQAFGVERAQTMVESAARGVADHIA